MSVTQTDTEIIKWHQVTENHLDPKTGWLVHWNFIFLCFHLNETTKVYTSEFSL